MSVMVLGKRKQRNLGQLLAESNTPHTVETSAPFSAITVNQYLLWAWPIGAQGKKIQQQLAQSTQSIRAIFADNRRTQLQSLFATEVETEVSTMTRQANRRLYISSLNLGLAIFSALVYPPLMIATLPGILYLTQRFYRNTYQALIKESRLSIDLIDAIAVTWSLAAGYFGAAVFMGFIFSLSIKFLTQTENNSRVKLTDVWGNRPQSVWVVVDECETQLPFEQLQPGHHLVVYAGEVVSVDGTIVAGMATIDQRALTGESQPVEKTVDDAVLASSVVLSGKVVVHVEQSGQDTVAAKIGHILENTTHFKTSMQAQVEAVVDKTVLPTLGLSGLAFLVRGSSGGIAVLFSSLGYNLRIFSPLTVLSFLRIAARRGILIKDGRSLEQLHRVDTVVFDKTGTLTLEQPQVYTVHSWNGLAPETILRYAAAAEYRQTHPIAKAILQAAEEQQLQVPPREEASYEMGYGLRVTVNNTLVRVGSANFMGAEGIALPSASVDHQTQAEQAGHSLVFVAVADELAGAIELQPTIRPEARHVVADLHQRGMHVAIISGDQETPTRTLAQELGIEHYFANTLPEHKAQLIAQLQDEGRTVCFVGDGINDAIALKQADVSVSLRGATSVAMDVAQVVLMQEHLNQFTSLLDVVAMFDQNMKWNMANAIAPGVLCVGGVFLFNLGIYGAVVLYNVGLLTGIMNTLVPLLQDQPVPHTENAQ